MSYFDAIPESERQPLARIAADVMEFAAAIGSDRIGATPYPYGFRINVGWTEILTAYTDGIRLVVDFEKAVAQPLAKTVELHQKKGADYFYKSVPGSALAIIRYKDTNLAGAGKLLREALRESVRLAGRRPASSSVKKAHTPQLLREITLVAKSGPTGGTHQGGNGIKGGARRTSGADLMEGALKRVVASRYERNASARRQCLDAFGDACAVCSFSFADAFGSLGEGFIHVHHVVPIAKIGKAYKIDPLKDLIPVCPNCHAMLHRSEPAATVAKLRALLKVPRE